MHLQDLVCAADDDEAMRSYRRALENSMTGASAAHPYELIGEEKMSLAKVILKASCQAFHLILVHIFWARIPSNLAESSGGYIISSQHTFIANL